MDSLYRVSLKCFIRNERDEVLVVKELGRSCWDLPGGGMEHGEDIHSAIARELHEELGYVGDFLHTLAWADNPAKLITRDVWQLKLVFIVSLDLENVRQGADVDEVRFIDPSTFQHSEHVPEQRIFAYNGKF